MIDDGGMAFPGTRQWDDRRGEWESTAEGGMSLRDYFAAAALPEIIRAYQIGNGPCLGLDHTYRNVPAHAYRMADAMLRARSEK